MLTNGVEVVEFIHRRHRCKYHEYMLELAKLYISTKNDFANSAPFLRLWRTHPTLTDYLSFIRRQFQCMAMVSSLWKWG